MAEQTDETQAPAPEPARVRMRDVMITMQAKAIECRCECGHVEVITLHDKDPAVAKQVADRFVAYGSFNLPPCRRCGRAGDGKRALLALANDGPNRRQRRSAK